MEFFRYEKGLVRSLVCSLSIHIEVGVHALTASLPAFQRAYKTENKAYTACCPGGHR